MTHQPARSAPVFSVEVVRDGDEVRISPFGELDIAVGPDLADAVDGLPFDAVKRIVLDLRELTFIDSAGVSFVLDLARRARAGDVSLVLVRGSEFVQRVLDLSGIERVRAIIAEPASRSSADRAPWRAYALAPEPRWSVGATRERRPFNLLA